MSSRADRAIQKKLLQGALVCAVLLTLGYFVFVSTAWGHRVDEDAYFGHEPLGRRIERLDVGILDLAASATWLLAAPEAPESSGTDLSFLVMAGLIILGAFSLTAWDGWQLRAVDWSAPSA